jgi:hypothetical protein
MALTHLISFSLRDYSGDPETCVFYADASLTVAEVQSLVNAIAPELDAITGMLIEGVSVALSLSLPAGLKGAATAGADAERGINWRFSKANSNYSHTIRTPGAPDAIVNGEDIIPSADTNDFLTVCLDGDATNEPSDEYGNDLLAALSQRVTFRK